MVAKKKRKPIPPYQAIGLSTVVYGVCERSQIKKNINNIEDAFRAAVEISNINMPVRIVALSEGALTGFTDEVFDIPHRVAAKEIFIDIPGEESERFGTLAKEYDTYIILQCKAVGRKLLKTVTSIPCS